MVSTFDSVWNRLTARLSGLADEEYFWEPVSGCWSLRPGPDRTWPLDGGEGAGPEPDPAPVTTIAWRLGHLAGMAVGGFTARRFPANATDFSLLSHAVEVPDSLEARYTAWREGLVGLDEVWWGASLGVDWGQYADSNTLDLALHVLDEVVHHGAEVGLLRDLFRDRSSLGR